MNNYHHTSTFGFIAHLLRLHAEDFLEPHSQSADGFMRRQLRRAEHWLWSLVPGGVFLGLVKWVGRALLLGLVLIALGAVIYGILWIICEIVTTLASILIGLFFLSMLGSSGGGRR